MGGILATCLATWHWGEVGFVGISMLASFYFGKYIQRQESEISEQYEYVENQWHALGQIVLYGIAGYFLAVILGLLASEVVSYLT